MRVLMACWAWPSHYFPMVPLGWALRAAGHEVLVACQPGLGAAVTGSGLPGAAVGSDVDVAAMYADPGPDDDELDVQRALDRALGDGVDMAEILRLGRSAVPERARPLFEDVRRRAMVRGLRPFVRVAEAMIDDLLAMVRSYRPDLVVHDPTTYAAPIAAVRHGIPTARQLWGVDYTCTTRELGPIALGPLCARYGVDARAALTLGTVTLDPCPEPAQIPVDTPRLRTAHLPYNGPSTVPSWLVGPPPRTRRICLTWGASSSHFSVELGQVRRLLDALVAADLSALDAEVVVAVSAKDRASLPADPPTRVRIVEGLSLHLLLPGCAAVIHQGGMGTTMTAVASGTPQLIVPQLTDQVVNARMLGRTGAAEVLSRDAITPDTLRDVLGRLLHNPHPRDRAAALRDELVARPALPETVRALVDVASGCN